MIPRFLRPAARAAALVPALALVFARASAEPPAAPAAPPGPVLAAAEPEQKGQPDPLPAAELQARIRRDYRLTRADLRRQLGERLRDVTDAEFDRWLAEGRFERREIDGEERFLHVSVSNLLFRHRELEARRRRPEATAPLERALLDNARAIRSAARQSGTPYVLPRRLQVRMTLTVATNAVPAGETIRAWLPIPRRLPFQDGFALLDGGDRPRAVDGPDSWARAAYFEFPAPPDATPAVTLRYAYTVHGVSFDLEPGRSRPMPMPASSPELRPWLGEESHLVFTPAMRELGRRIAGAETNQVRLARAFYHWIGDHLRYSFAPEYSTVANLGELCRAQGYGDCGMEAFVFMTLCRLHGIPARWQSGWSLFPGAETIHDWCEIHLAPWGWVPVDPYMAIYAMQYTDHLSGEERRELRDFHFGGLSQYRLVANSAHARPLAPPKRWPRSDTVDFQRGEVETASGNLYFDRFNYDLKWEEVPVAPGTR